MNKREYNRTYYAKRTPAAKKRKVRLQNARKQKNRLLIEAFKTGNPCKCGENYSACLEFHHNIKSKEINISDAISRGWSMERIMKEIEKCIVLCANCHRKLHDEKRK